MRRPHGSGLLLGDAFTYGTVGYLITIICVVEESPLICNCTNVEIVVTVAVVVLVIAFPFGVHDHMTCV